MHAEPCCTSSTIFWINQNSEILDEVKARCAQVFISNTRYPRPAVVYLVVLALAIGHLISYMDSPLLRFFEKGDSLTNALLSVARQYCHLASRWERSNVGSVIDVLACVMFTDILFYCIQSVRVKWRKIHPCSDSSIKESKNVFIKRGLCKHVYIKFSQFIHKIQSGRETPNL